MIVAGGRGTRLAPLTDTTPKPLLPLVGVPFLHGQVSRLAAAGIRRVWLVVGQDTSPFSFLVDAFASHGVTITLVPEPEPLDTAGGVRAVIDETDGPVVVCNGDVLTDVDVRELGAAHRAADAIATLSVIRVDDPSTYGVCVREGSRIIDFVEKPAPGTLPGQDTVNAGTYVLAPGALDAFPHGRLSFERDVFPGLLASGAHVESVVWDGVWVDLGTPARLLRGHRLVLDGTMPWPVPADLVDLGDGVRVHPDAHVDDGAHLRGPLAVLAGATVDAATIGPHVVLGPDTSVAAGVRVSNTVTRTGAVIGAGVALDSCILGRGATVADHDQSGVDLHDVVLADGVSVGPGDDLPAGARVEA